jgi:hypothetical protein
MPAYVLLKKKIDHGISLPNFELYSHLPPIEEKGKVVVIEDDYYLDVARITLSDDLSYVNVIQYRITNIAEIITEEVIDRYTLSSNFRE